ncbi:MAG: hypothetical protein U9O56_03630 [Campylobacterota bacterium]|nr:hypothetical protein [Campylobacterota bacterium]
MISFFTLISYISSVHYDSEEIYVKKNDFISVVGLPDLAISTEANYIRHRSLSDIKMIFIDGPEHIEYFPSSFTINHNQGSK